MFLTEWHQFGNPWQEWMDRFATMPAAMLAAAPISSEKDPLARHTIRALTPEESAEWDRRIKEWEESPFAGNWGIDNAVQYKVETPSGQSNLVNNVSKQIQSRTPNLPSGTKQTVIVDVRGQTVSNTVLKSIRSRILEKSGVEVEIIFKR